MPSIVGNIMDWSKWSWDSIINTPFTPLILVVETILSNQQEQNEVDYSDTSVIQDILAKEPTE